ncbi:MAG: hypothetical protein ACKOHG_00445, partial [Planctomycetia bacterium]
RTYCHGPGTGGGNYAIEGTTSPVAWWHHYRGDESLIADTQISWSMNEGTTYGNVTGIVNPLGTRVSNGDSIDNNFNWRKGSTCNVPIRSAHAGKGAFLLFADGSVQFLAEGIDTDLFKDLAVRDQGLVKQLP